MDFIMHYKDKAREIAAQLTLEEKASLTSGLNFWYLKGIDRLGLPSIMVTDGPHGLRKQDGSADQIGIMKSVPAVCFPTSAATACSFDRNLIERIGAALGEECRQEDVAVILGPGVNIKRSPLCGRNFEYFSEDPYLSGELASALVRGVQGQNVGVSVKHYAFNNQETRRMTSDSVVDERTAREIYLPAFEAVVKNAGPWTLMCSYNRFESEYCSENRRLLTDILRDEWGFDGLVMSDWGAVNDRCKGVSAGLDLQMPADGGNNDKLVIGSVRNGSLSEAELDAAVINVIGLILKSQDRAPFRYDSDIHRALAAQAAIESTVLLKNEDNILPAPERAEIALIGAFAEEPRYQGAGSSKIEPVKLDSVCDCLKESGAAFVYAAGYRLDSDRPDESLIAEAAAMAKDKDRVFIIAGLPALYESEGFDRTSMKMPESHNRLIESVAMVNENVIVVLLGGAPMEMIWQDRVKGILLCYLGGEAIGKAVADLISGKASPGGRLAESWPFSAEDSPSAAFFPGYQKTTEYRESIYVGYRYYDTAEKPVRFPFGFGLSYTSFDYSEPKLSRTSMDDTETLTVSISVKNTGKLAGSEVVQLYVAHKNPTIFKAAQELKGFEKVILEPGESRTVGFSLGKQDFAYYNTLISDWHVESGEYELRIGASSRDIRIRETVKVNSTVQAQIPDFRVTAAGYYDLKQGIANIPYDDFAAILGRPLPPRDRGENEPFDGNSTFGEIRSKWFGRLFTKMVKKQAAKALGGAADDLGAMIDSVFEDMPMRSLKAMAGDRITPSLMDGLLTVLNGSFFAGVLKMMKRR